MSPDPTTTSGQSSSTSSVRDELSQDAGRLADTAKQRATQEAESQKQQVTQTARSTSSALTKAADELEQDDNAPNWLGSAFRKTAEGIERLAGNVEGRNADQLAGDLSRFARQNSGTFLAASAAAGFVAARFLRAGVEYQHDHRCDSDQARRNAGGGYGSTTGIGAGSGMDSGAGSTGGTGTGYASTGGTGYGNAGTTGYASSGGTTTGTTTGGVGGDQGSDRR